MFCMAKHLFLFLILTFNYKNIILFSSYFRKQGDVIIIKCDNKKKYFFKLNSEQTRDTKRQMLPRHLRLKWNACVY